MLHLAEQAAAEPRRIKAGDLVIVYERYDSMKSMTVTHKGQYNNRWGSFKMKDWIGKPFGSRVTASSSGGGYVFLLALTPELWTLVLHHRTQILYVADISMVVSFLELTRGDIVLESGTGSGSLTTALARAVAPTGRVYTFEHHQVRAETAAAEFQQNGIGDIVHVDHRDIEGLGFPKQHHGTAQGVFLDLPAPWKAAASAVQCLMPNGVFISFSPCIEQVQRTCEAIHAAGCVHLRTFECLLRQYEVQTVHMSTDLDAAHKAGSVSGRKRKQQGGEATPLPGADSTISQTLAKPCMAARGHTGYLLTARKAVAVE